jgi:hypothetical protein
MNNHKELKGMTTGFRYYENNKLLSWIDRHCIDCGRFLAKWWTWKRCSDCSKKYRKNYIKNYERRTDQRFHHTTQEYIRSHSETLRIGDVF